MATGWDSAGNRTDDSVLKHARHKSKDSIFSGKDSVTSLQGRADGGFLLKIKKTSNKPSSNSSQNVSIKNLKEDFQIEYRIDAKRDSER